MKLNNETDRSIVLSLFHHVRLPEYSSKTYWTWFLTFPSSLSFFLMWILCTDVSDGLFQNNRYKSFWTNVLETQRHIALLSVRNAFPCPHIQRVSIDLNQKVWQRSMRWQAIIRLLKLAKSQLYPKTTWSCLCAWHRYTANAGKHPIPHITAKSSFYS